MRDIWDVLTAHEVHAGLLKRIADLERQLLDTTWQDHADHWQKRALKAEQQLAEAHEVLAECREYFYERADAEYFTDSPEPVGNEEMTLLCMIEDVAIGRSATAPESDGSPESPKE